MNLTNKEKLIIWDSKDCPPEDMDGQIVFWGQKFDRPSNAISISDLIESNPDAFRSEYLDLIFRINNVSVSGIPVKDYLKVTGCDNFLSLTLLSEKSNWARSPRINVILKVIAIKNFILAEKITNITLITTSGVLGSTIEALAKFYGIEFGSSTNYRRRVFTTLMRRVLYVLKSVTWLIREVLTYWPLKGNGLERWANSKNQTTFISYSLGLDYKKALNGDFLSPYWGNLPKSLSQNSIYTSWIHIPTRSEMPVKKLNRMIRRLDLNNTRYQNHILLQSFMDLRLIIKSISDFILIVKNFKSVGRAIVDEAGFYCYLLHDDIDRSFLSTEAMSVIFSSALFEKANSSCAPRKIGIYLCENNSWEVAFNFSFRKYHKMAESIGFCHSTVRYWDLRYFHDPRFYDEKDKKNSAIPDFFAVNGPLAREIMMDGNCPSEKLIEVEATRFMYLQKFERREIKTIKPNAHLKILLVLGDYNKYNTEFLISLLVNMDSRLSANFRLLIKPHPACPIEIDTFSEFLAELTPLDMSDAFKLSDIVLTANNTSSAIEAYYLGIKVISTVDLNNLNMSPLRGLENAIFVSDSQMLNSQLELLLTDQKDKKTCDFFNLDPNFSLWLKLMLQS